MYGKLETPSTSGEGERKFTESYTHPFPFSFPYHFFQITISKIHGKTELDAAGFIRADENDKRAPA